MRSARRVVRLATKVMPSTCLHRFEALPLSMLGLESNVHALWVEVPLAQALEPLPGVLKGRFEVVLGGEQAQLALKPGLPRREVRRRPVCLRG